LDNAGAGATRHSSGSWLVKHCGQCGFVYLENPPDYSALQEQWAWEKTSSAEKARRKSAEPLFQGLARFAHYFRWRILKRDKLTPLLRRYFLSGPVVDVGCGRGLCLRRLGELGFAPHGVEVSSALAEMASAHAAPFGGRVVAANAVDGLGQFADHQFTGAILISFLEHESNPLPLLTRLRSKLAQGGRMVVKVPNFGCWNRAVRGARWCGFRFPDHVNYFTPRTLREMIQRAGFKIIRFSPLDRFPLSDNMWAVCQTA
jgi:2-polyprenyl-3-methyl-5-hydroxy-6-metoxy-1,4-benzoquinol methylase